MIWRQCSPSSIITAFSEENLAFLPISPTYRIKGTIPKLRDIRLESENDLATSMSKRLNNYIRTYRRRASLTQKDVAFLLGSSDAAQVCDLEHGKYNPSLYTALALAWIFGVSVSVLFHGVDELIRQRIAIRASQLIALLATDQGPRRTSVLARRLESLDGLCKLVHRQMHQLP